MRYKQATNEKMINELYEARQRYEKVMMFVHGKNVGRMQIQREPQNKK